MKVGLDLDGCLVNWSAGIAQRLQQRGYAVPSFRLAFPETWDWPQDLGVPDAVVQEVYTETHADPHFWRDLQALPEVTQTDLPEYLRWQESRGARLYFLTYRRGVDVHRQSVDWVQRELGLRHPQVLVLTGAKAPVVEALGLDLVFDDMPSVIASFDGLVRDGWWGMPYHILRPYNTHVQAVHPVRVDTVREAFTHYDQLKERRQ